MFRTQPMTANEVLQRLLEGNKRYVVGGLRHAQRNLTPERRKQVAGGQSPLAVIIGCSDSRVPPEVIFDQGLGDVYVIRLAGNLVDNLALGSVEYAAQRLGAPLALVLGHGRCSAVTLAVEVVEKGAPAPGYLGSLVEAIWPAMARAKSQAGDLIENTVRANVALVVERLKRARPILADLAQGGRLSVVGARYDMDTGLVEIIA